MWELVAAGLGDGFLVADGSSSGRMLEDSDERHIELARVIDLGEALSGS